MTGSGRLRTKAANLSEGKRISLQSFLIVFLCVALPLSFFAANSALRQAEQARAGYDQSMAARAARVGGLVAVQFDALERTANEIYYASWYKRFISNSEVYQKEMDIVYRLVVVDDIKYKCTMLPLVNDIIVLDTRRDAIVCRYGWFSSQKKYADAYCPLLVGGTAEDILDTDLFAAVRSLDPDKIILSYPDPNGNHGCRIGIVLRRADVERYILSLGGEDEGWSAVLTRGDDPVWAGEQPTGDVIGVQVARSGLFLRFTYPPYGSLYGGSDSRTLFIYLGAALCLAACIAYLLTCMLARPLARLLSHMPDSGAHSHKAAYHAIEQHIESITRQNESLTFRLRSFAASFQGDWLLGRMMGRSAAGEERQMMLRLFPWIEAQRPYFFVLLGRAYAESEAREEIARELTEAGAQCVHLTMPLEYAGMIVWAENAGACDRARERLLSADPSVSQLAVSSVYRGDAQLRACYADAIRQAESWQSDLSLADACELLNGFQNGDPERCRSALAALKSNKGDAALPYLYDLLKAWTGDAPEDEISYEALEALAESRCSEGGDGEPSVILTAVNAFLDQYYALPDMSLKYLAEEFHSNVSAMSRLYKRETGKNFSDQLLSLRMERAKTLLTSTPQSIAVIAQACGYENYLSFKRAFIRSEGVSPREWRDVNR